MDPFRGVLWRLSSPKSRPIKASFLAVFPTLRQAFFDILTACPWSCSSSPSQTFPNPIRSTIFETATDFVKDSVQLAHAAPMGCHDVVQAREAGGENIHPAFWSIQENLDHCPAISRAAERSPLLLLSASTAR